MVRIKSQRLSRTDLSFVIDWHRAQSLDIGGGTPRRGVRRAVAGRHAHMICGGSKRAVCGVRRRRDSTQWRRRHAAGCGVR